MKKVVSVSPLQLDSNPYIELLHESVRDCGWELCDCGLNAILRLRPRIFHMHWPEWSLTSRSGRLAPVKSVYFLMRLALYKLLGMKVIWTVHNLKPHDCRVASPIVDLFYYCFITFVDGCVFLSIGTRTESCKAFPRLKKKDSVIVHHGDYRAVIPEHEDRQALRDRFNFSSDAKIFAAVGAIKNYKNIPALIRSFRLLDGGQYKLIIAGAVSSEALKLEIQDLVKDDPRIVFYPDFMTDMEMAEFAEVCDVIVMPYKSILNSGSALYALSMNRVILAPELGVFRDLSKDLPDWLALYSGDLSPANLVRSIELSGKNQCQVCDLSAYEWSRNASVLTAFYQRSL